ncbi:cytochrome c biogenesis protein CcdA [Dongia deserti]|uniref:cytochrome c biogenesis protein CcdA n=1 Tax=Dongia deserti TaxID=2268030 RepID=UPI000E64E5CB|nr:cytochrome c biogenesis protein CcdA [Dongia deserti]
MAELEPLLQNISGLSAFAIGLVALAGLVVGLAPSSLPLISVAAGLAGGREAAQPTEPWAGIRLAFGFALGIATIDALVGALFGLAGLAVLRILASALAVAYALLGALLAVVGLALLRVIRISIPALSPSLPSRRTFLGSYLLGLPFGLSTCPACTPLVLPVVAAAASTADPAMGGILMFTFGITRGIPIVLAGGIAGRVSHLRRTRSFIRWVERVSGIVILGAAAYFFLQATIYAGWLKPWP